MNSKNIIKKRYSSKRKIILIIILSITAGVFVLSRAKDRIIKKLSEDFLSSFTGAQVEIDKFNLNIPLGSLKIEGFKMRNPPGFSPDILLDLPKISIELDRLAITKGKLHLRHLDIELKTLLFEKDRQGKMNVDALKISSSPAPEFIVDLLNLEIKQIIEKDCGYEKPLIKAHDVNLKRSYRNLTDINQVITLIFTESLKEAGIKGAKILGLSALMGGAVALPIAVAITNIGRESVRQEIEKDVDSLYDLSLKVLDGLGDIKKQDKTAGLISADIHGASVLVSLKQVSSKASQVTVKAKWFILPEHEIASGVLYEIIEKSQN